MSEAGEEGEEKKKSFTAFSLFVHVVAFLNIHCIFLKIISTSLVCYIIDSIVPGAELYYLWLYIFQLALQMLLISSLYLNYMLFY